MAVPKLNPNEIVMKIALKVEDLATEHGRIPFLSGDLRKSITSELIGRGIARVGSPLPYARAVHDGRKALTIRPNVQKNPPYGKRKHKDPKRARLKFKVGGVTVFAKKVHQKARKGRPFFREAIDELQSIGFGWLKRDLARTYSKALLKNLPRMVKIELK